MRKNVPVKLEIAKADFYFSVDRLTKAFRSVSRSVDRLSYELAAANIEAALAEKDDPFDEDGQPIDEAMRNHAECDLAIERLNELRISRISEA